MSGRRKETWARVGRELARLRARAKMTQTQVGILANVVSAQVSAWENGKRGMTESQAAALDQALNANGRLVRVWERENSGENLPAWYERSRDFERRVSMLREYQCQIFPGLIQTEDYARTVIRDSLPWTSAAEVEKMVMSRMARQEILARDHPPLVGIVVEEFVLSRIVGDERAQIDQLDHVLRLIEDRRIDFQVMPSNSGRHPGTAGPFCIYTFPDNPMLASAEYAGGEVVMDDPRKVENRMTIFGLIQAEALSPKSSAELIRKVRKNIED